MRGSQAYHTLQAVHSDYLQLGVWGAQMSEDQTGYLEGLSCIGCLAISCSETCIENSLARCLPCRLMKL